MLHETNTKSAAAVACKNNISGSCQMRAICCPSAHKSSKVSCRQHKQTNRQREGIGWCGFRSMFSSVTARLTTGIANRRGILKNANHVWAQSHLQTSSSAKRVSKNTRNIAPTTEMEESNISVQYLSQEAAQSGKDTRSTTYVGKWEGEDDGMKKIEDDGCSGWWWWDNACYDLTSVTPADVSTFWNEFNSWLTTAVLDDDDDDSSQMKATVDCCSSSSSSTAAQHVTSLSGTRDEDELVNESNDDGAGKVEDKMNETSLLYWRRSALKMMLLLAASHGHRDIVCDILQQTSHAAREVATVDTGLHDFINCIDSQVGLPYSWSNVVGYHYQTSCN